VGTVTSAAVDRESEPFLRIKVKLAANLDQLEVVLVITKIAEQTPSVAEDPNAVRAADVLARRLPTVTRSQDKTEGTTPDTQKKPAVAPARKPVARPPAGNAGKPPQ
jgi:hypothetical protein